MKKVWNFIYKYRIVIALVFLLIIGVFGFITVKQYLYPDDKLTVYGNRLDGIDKVKITDSIKAYVEEKLGKLDQYFERPAELKAYVVIRVRNKSDIIEVTIPTPKFSLRAETSHEDLYAAIDLTVAKLEGQIRKNKTKMRKKFKDIMQYELLMQEEEPENTSDIVKRKTIELKPMDEEEAILQMELLGHDFYIFKNVKSGTVSVLYRRRDGSYGIIEEQE